MAAGKRGIALLEWLVICTAICAIMLLLRLLSARIQKRKAYADDWMVLVAFASVVALDGAGIWAVYNGIGKRTDELDLHEIGIMQKLVVASDVCWLVGTVFNKLSLLWLYRRIFKTPAFLKWSMVLFIVVVAFGIAFIVVFMTQCHPVSYIWNPVPGGGCRNMTYQEYASVSVNMAIDLAIFILPLPVLWRLQMTTRNKFYVTVMLSFGLITIAVMAWRIQATYMSEHDPDFVYSLATIGLIAGLELWLGIIVACMPTIPPVLQTYVRPVFQRLTSYYYSRRSSNQDQRGISHKPSPSDEFQLNRSSRETCCGAPHVSASFMSTEVSSLGRGQAVGSTGAFGSVMHGKRGDKTYTTMDGEDHGLRTASDGGDWNTNPQKGANVTYAQDELAGMPGIHVHRQVDRQEEYSHNMIA